MDYYGTRLATCSSDRCVRVFDLKEGGVQTLAGVLQGHEGPVWQVAWANPKFGNILASCSYDRKARKHQVANLLSSQIVIFSPDQSNWPSFLS